MKISFPTSDGHHTVDVLSVGRVESTDGGSLVQCASGDFVTTMACTDVLMHVENTAKNFAQALRDKRKRFDMVKKTFESRKQT